MIKANYYNYKYKYCILITTYDDELWQSVQQLLLYKALELSQEKTKANSPVSNHTDIFFQQKANFNLKTMPPHFEIAPVKSEDL